MPYPHRCVRNVGDLGGLVVFLAVLFDEVVFDGAPFVLVFCTPCNTAATRVNTAKSATQHIVLRR